MLALDYFCDLDINGLPSLAPMGHGKASRLDLPDENNVCTVIEGDKRLNAKELIDTRRTEFPRANSMEGQNERHGP